MVAVSRSGPFDHGLRERLDPGPPETRNFAEVVRDDPTARRIPTTLRDALDAPAADPVFRAALPGKLHEIYDEYKRDEWNRFIRQTSDWDVKTYLDCLP